MNLSSTAGGDLVAMKGTEGFSLPFTNYMYKGELSLEISYSAGVVLMKKITDLLALLWPQEVGPQPDYLYKFTNHQFIPGIT